MRRLEREGEGDGDGGIREDEGGGEVIMHKASVTEHENKRVKWKLT